ncbi:OB-fold domain-containing protein [Piscinibacter sp. XHJ-5]|uniref:Zn-ribbon domain-containing OB-fold protein n=1 Tax=Piscinibacter sp. XHJ-5 TaxID=3037797 RepID=UPI00245361B6|nr:OB-fold domain-containing protein [Piscinibacter sp. XHJ-5]
MHPEKEYLEHLAAGRFMLQQACCPAGNVLDADGHVFPPRIAQPGSGVTRLEWVEACGRATVYSTTVIRQKPPAPNYNVALIDLEEGVRMMARVDGIAPEMVTIGMAVRARVIRENDQPLVVFVPTEGDSHA